MSRNPSRSESHCFAVEELLDLYYIRWSGARTARRRSARRAGNSSQWEAKRVEAPQSQTKWKQQQQSRASVPRPVRVERKKIPMIEAQQEYRRSTSTRIIPALLHIQELEQPGSATEEPQRRITVLLDHPVVKQLGWSSWLLAIVTLAATQKVAAIPISVVVLAGLLVGFINAMRWLFARKR
jgi:hypothetical protein